MGLSLIPVTGTEIARTARNKTLLEKKRSNDEITSGAGVTQAQSNEEKDWRVRLLIPDVLKSDSIFNIFDKTTNGHMIFPNTPTITVSHVANYNSLQPIHNNYSFFAYENSQVESITIVGDFTVETPGEALYWATSVHFLRSITKMFYSNDDLSGNPPVISRLNGYGNFVLNNIPVVITSFQVELPSNVDYISFTPTTSSESGSSFPKSWAPTKSTITVSCQPIYSRKSVSSFSLNEFVKGSYIIQPDKGFI